MGCNRSARLGRLRSKPMFIPALAILALRNEPTEFVELQSEFRQGLVFLTLKDESGKPVRMLMDSGSPQTFTFPTDKSHTSKLRPVRVRLGKVTLSSEGDVIEIGGRIPGVSMEGVLGTDVLQRCGVLIDYESQRVWACGLSSDPFEASFQKALEKAQRGGDQDVVRLPLSETEEGWYQTDLDWRGGKTGFVVDTGSNHVGLPFGAFKGRKEGTWFRSASRWSGISSSRCSLDRIEVPGCPRLVVAAIENESEETPPNLGASIFSNRWIYIDFAKESFAFPRSRLEEGVRTALEGVLGASLKLDDGALQIGAASVGWHPLVALVGQPSREVMALFQNAAKDDGDLDRARLFAAELHEKHRVTLRVNASEVEVEIPGT